jgi:hypothetical protein
MWQLKNLLNTRVVFCANQISMVVANQLVLKKKPNDHFIIVYDPLRCDESIFSNNNQAFIKINKLTFLGIYLKSIVFRPAEVVVPHFKWKAARLLAKLSKKVSLIDDGLDTLRKIPNNVDPFLIKRGSTYYTFNYKFKLPIWLNAFELLKLCPLNEIAKSKKNIINLNKYDVVYVESPGLTESLINDNSHRYNNALLIKHSNPNKSNIDNFDGDVILGSELALEATLANYSGKIFVGESMIAVYLINLKKTTFKIILCVKENSVNNLGAFLSMGNACSNVSIIETS